MDTLNSVYTPYTGANGNWYVNNEDTGVKAQGPAGHQGPVGPQGEIGPQGDTGDRGPQGIQGPTGPQGATGPQGIKGTEGDKGEKGDMPSLTANLLATTPGTALDATMGKALNDRVDMMSMFKNIIIYSEDMGTIADILDNLPSGVSAVYGFFSTSTTPSDYPKAELGSTVYATMNAARYGVAKIADITNIQSSGKPNHISVYRTTTLGTIWSNTY